MAQSTTSARPGLFPLGQALASLFTGIATAVFNLPTLMVEWQKRYEMRRHIEGLDARLLDDIGLTPEQARYEASKPFWIS